LDLPSLNERSWRRTFFVRWLLKQLSFFSYCLFVCIFSTICITTDWVEWTLKKKFGSVERKKCYMQNITRIPIVKYWVAIHSYTQEPWHLFNFNSAFLIVAYIIKGYPGEKYWWKKNESKCIHKNVNIWKNAWFAILHFSGCFFSVCNRSSSK
jgi:hypothetical protein